VDAEAAGYTTHNQLPSTAHRVQTSKVKLCNQNILVHHVATMSTVRFVREPYEAEQQKRLMHCNVDSWTSPEAISNIREGQKRGYVYILVPPQLNLSVSW